MNIRSFSSIGALGDPAARVSGTSVHCSTVDSSVLYFSCCSGVSSGRALGVELSRGLAKGVLMRPSAADVGRLGAPVDGVSDLISFVPFVVATSFSEMPFVVVGAGVVSAASGWDFSGEPGTKAVFWSLVFSIATSRAACAFSGSDPALATTDGATGCSVDIVEEKERQMLEHR
jgi:hypothetical protein